MTGQEREKEVDWQLLMSDCPLIGFVYFFFLRVQPLKWKMESLSMAVKIRKSNHGLNFNSWIDALLNNHGFLFNA